jgi:hypothetical protein
MSAHGVQPSFRAFRNLSKLWERLMPAFAEHALFRTKGELGRVQAQQHGTFRTNCIDCLDRTNVVQAFVARKALESFLRSLLLLSPEQEMAAQFPEVRRPPTCSGLIQASNSRVHCH